MRSELLTSATMSVSWRTFRANHCRNGPMGVLLNVESRATV